MAKIVYLRTDKNGTKYYANYTCPRCGGAGGSDKWAFTGWTCYECGGTGESSTPVIEKEYTPEYRAKLDERARKRAEAKRAKQVEEFNNNRLAIAEKYGFNPEGKIYVVTGNTYEIREELREAGAKYRGGINWYFLEKQDRYPTIELSYEECLNIYPEYGTMSWKDLTEVQAVLNSKIPTEEDPSQYVGQVGERLDLVVTFKKRSTYEIPSYAGWGTDAVGINVFRDDVVLCQYLVQVKMRNFSHFNPPEAQPQCVFFYTIVRIHLVTYSYNGYEFVSYCRKLPDIRKSSSMPACNREF